MSMFNFIDPKEERHERIAQIAANLCKKEQYDPTDALSKVASENALNSAETEDVCAKLNHILFREKFAEDKLAVFNAAQYDKVTQQQGDGIGKIAAYEPQNTIKDELEKRAAEIASMPMEQPPMEGEMPPQQQPDPIAQEAGDKYRNHEFNRFIEQTATNASEISAHHMAIDNIVTEMKERILALFREGVPLEEIYDTILVSLGESQAPAVEQYFTQVIEELKQEGLMPPDQKLYINDPEKVAADFSVSKKLSKLAEDLKDHTNKVIIKEAAHEVALDMITEMGRYDIAEQLDKHVDSMRMLGTLEKTAAHNIKDLLDMAKNSLTKLPDSAKDKLMGGAALAAGTAAIGGVVMAAGEGYRGIKRAILKRKLPNMFPELQNIPKEQYGHLYDTITVLDPTLVKTPYAVAEMVKRFADYGTIDTGNILQLQAAHKPGPTFSDFAVNPARDVMTDIGASYFRAPKDGRPIGGNSGPQTTQ